MSYDLCIRSDDDYSVHTDPRALHAYIAGLPSMSSVSGAELVFGDGINYHMELFVEFIVDGDSRSVTDRVNCVNCHIPYAYLLDDNDPVVYFKVCHQIARHLGWRLYDQQSGEYIEPD